MANLEIKHVRCLERMKNYKNGVKLRKIELIRLNVKDKHKYKVEIKCMLFSCSKTNVS